MSKIETSNEVFIVDDDPTAGCPVQDLNQAGYRAITFEDGPSFVAAARERCRLRHLDIYMPGRSGLEDS